jgi:hypothetical protein
MVRLRVFVTATAPGAGGEERSRLTGDPLRP